MKTTFTTEELVNTFNMVQTIRTAVKADKEYGFNLPFSDFINIMRLLPSQSYGIRVEKYIAKMFNMESVPMSKEMGDFRLGSVHFEFKVSMLTETNRTLKLMQIRPWQDITYYMAVAIDTTKPNNETRVFMLSREELMDEMRLIGATASHGTSKANRVNEKVEVQFGVEISNKDGLNNTFNRWMNQYYCEDISSKLNKK